MARRQRERLRQQKRREKLMRKQERREQNKMSETVKTDNPMEDPSIDWGAAVRHTPIDTPEEINKIDALEALHEKDEEEE